MASFLGVMEKLKLWFRAVYVFNLCHVLGTFVLCLSFPIALQGRTCQLCHPLLVVPPLSPSRLQPWHVHHCKSAVLIPVTRRAPLLWREYVWQRGLAGSEGTMAGSVMGLPMAMVLGHSENILSWGSSPCPAWPWGHSDDSGVTARPGAVEGVPWLTCCWPLAWCAVPPALRLSA